MNPDQIRELCQSKKEAFKSIKHFVDGVPSKKEHEVVPPDFYPHYSKCVLLWEKIRPHSEDDYFPYNLFRKKAPNQKEEEFIYSKELYKVTGTPTHSYWAKAVSVINRIWNEKNYSIQYPTVEGIEYENYQPKDYFEKDFPEYKSIESYFREIVTPMKIQDPNAWLALDVKLYYQETENEGEYILDQSLPAEPYLCVIPCHKVVDFKAGEWVLTLTDEKSWVDWGGVSKKEGYVLNFRDRTGLYRIEQTGKKIDYEFSEPDLIYPWEFDYLPAQRLKGDPQKGSEYFKSVFMPAVPSLNTALLDANVLAVSKFANAFPERWEYVDDCDAVGCEGGVVWDDERTTGRRCGSCGGTARKNYASPLSVMQIPAPKEGNALAVQSDKMHPPFAGYVEKTGATDMLKFLDDQVKKNCEEAFLFLNIDVSNSEAHGSETALGKQIDREELFSFLLSFSNEDFDLLKFGINICGIVRYGERWDAVEIGYPQNFTIRDDQDITREITDAKNAGLPTVAQTALIHEYFGNRFNSRADVDRRFQLIRATDRMLSFSSTEVLAKLASGVVLKWHVILHDQIDYFIEKADREKEGFWDMDLKDQIKLLEKLAQAEEKAINIPKITPEQIFAQQQQDKAEAANKLRATVGGTQAFLAIIEAINAGRYTLEAAVNFVMNTYGLTEDEARAQLGNPPRITNPDDPMPSE